MIRVEGLTKLYGDTEAVRDLVFDVAPGEIVGLVGPNGAGKTTTLRCMAGILPPTAGRVVIDGRDLDADGVEARRRLAYVPDEPELFENLTADEHLRFIAAMYRVEDAPARIDRLLAEFELEEKRREPVSDLSRGMKQKLAVCCAYLYEPRAILFDEPLTGLDPRAIRRAIDSIRERARAGAAIVLSSHLLTLVEDLCDRILIVHRGRRVEFGTLDQIRAQAKDLAHDATLEQIFLRATDE